MKSLLTVLTLATLSFTVQAERYSDTGFEKVAEDYAIFQLSHREAATVNFRTACGTIYGSDDVNCSVRLYDGRKGIFPGEYYETHLLLCDKQDCIMRDD